MFIFDSLVMINSCDGEGWHAVWRSLSFLIFFLMLDQDFLSKMSKNAKKRGPKKRVVFYKNGT